MAEKSNYYVLSVEDVITSLSSSTKGLSYEEAKKRLKKYGYNELIEKKRESPLILLLKQFTNFLVIILLIAAGVSAVLGDVVEFITIMAIVIMAGVVGFVQEYRAEKALEALKRMAAPTANVVREGKEEKISARELVPGDIVLVRVGDKVPADCRLIEAVNLQIDEAPLTGESTPVEKTIEPLKGEVAIGDQKNMIFFGTTVAYGRGKAIVTSTGMQTEFGKIAGMLQEVEVKKTPLQVNLDRTSKWIGTYALILCAIIAFFGITRGYPILEMFVWGVALAVAVIPEALPAVVTISLALGVRRMVKRNALIRKLPAVETLGCVSVICSDKTGTLTKDEMTVRKLWVNNKLIDVTGSGYNPEGEFYVDGRAFQHQEPHLQTLLRIGALCNDTELLYHKDEKRWDIKGDPTEGALTVVAAKGGIWQNEANEYYKRYNEIPFSSERKRMTTLHATPYEKTAFSKGAPEVILKCCKYILEDGQERLLTEEDREKIHNTAEQMASQALRVIGLAYKKLDRAEDLPIEMVEQDMVFAGLAGMIDPPRDEVKNSIMICEEAGIKPIMITGDHKITAAAIARELGMLKKEEEVITGIELDRLSQDEFEKNVEKIAVYARVSPLHKLRIVEAFQKKGRVVSMTGDGINDAPALKAADIGVAMGITGTDVSKEASDMVLTDDNFASIVSAVEEGRTIFANIRKCLVYLLTGNMGSVFGITAALLTGLPLPLFAVQILFINLLMDGAPAVALSVEPPERGVMKKPPRPKKENIFDRHALTFIPLMGLWIAIWALGFFIYTLNTHSLEKAMTMFFATIITLRLVNALNCRSPEISLFKMGFFTNKWLLIAMASSFLLMLSAIYIPFLQVAIRTVPLTATDWLMIATAAVSVIAVDELHKLIKAKRKK